MPAVIKGPSKPREQRSLKPRPASAVTAPIVRPVISNKAVANAGPSTATGPGGEPIRLPFGSFIGKQPYNPPSPPPTPGTLAGFIAWVRSTMGISTTILPDSSVWFTYAFNVAVGIVNQDLARVGISPDGTTVYTLALYNLAGSNLLNYAQDLPGAAIIPGSDPPQPFFAYTRQKWNMTSFVSGTVQSTSDEGTSMSLVVPEQLQTLTIANLQYLKDPYGRQYLMFAQDYGTLWGLS